MPEARIRVKVQPGSRKSEVAGFQGEVLRLRVTAPPEGGRANQAVVDLLSKALGVAKGRVTIVRGASAREKVVTIQGVDAQQVREALGGGGQQDLGDHL